MTIGELAARTGLATSAIRYYEREGLIPKARRLSGRRVFEERSLSHLAVVRLARSAGFTVAEIRRLVTEFGRDRWRRLAERKHAEIEEAARRLQSMADLLERLLRCECPDLEFCGRALRRAERGRPLRPARRALPRGIEGIGRGERI